MVLTASKTRKRPATYADLEAVPPHLVAEILGGELVTRSRLPNRHATAHGSLIEEVAGPFQKGRDGKPGGWIFKPEPELHLGEHVGVPDIAGWPHWIVLATFADFQDVCAKPFDAITFNLGQLWPFDEPPATEA